MVDVWQGSKYVSEMIFYHAFESEVSRKYLQIGMFG